MGNSQHRTSGALLDDVRATIERLEKLVHADPERSLSPAERPAVDRALLQSLEQLTDDEAIKSLVASFSAGAERRGALVSDVLITLRLLEQALAAP